MSGYVPQEGDNVRVVLEGEATAVETATSGRTYFDIRGADHWGNNICVGSDVVVSVEKIMPPLPTAPGSVVRDRNGRIWMRQDKEDARNGYSWISPDGNKCGDGYLGFQPAFDVIHDAGAES